MRRSTALSIENTPTNTPAGGSASRSRPGGGNVSGVKPAGGGNGKLAVGDIERGGGADEYGGMVQYPRHGRGSLSGLRM